MKYTTETEDELICHNMHYVIIKQNYLKKNVLFYYALFLCKNKKENFFKEMFQFLKETAKIKTVLLNLTQSVLH